MVAGFIKLDRNVAEKLRELPDECYGVYMRVLAAVNWKPKKWNGITIQPGQMVYARRLLAERLYSCDKPPAYNTIRKRLDELAEHGLLEIEGRPRYTLLTVSNFDAPIGDIGSKYEPNLEPKSEPKSEPYRRHKKTVKKECARPTLQELKTYWTGNRLNGDPESFFDHFESNGWKVSGRTPMKDWKAAARNWSRRQSEFGNGQSSPPIEDIPIFRGTRNGPRSKTSG